MKFSHYAAALIQTIFNFTAREMAELTPLVASHSAQVPSADHLQASQESKLCTTNQYIWTQHSSWWQKLWWAKCWWWSWLLFSFTPSFTLSFHLLHRPNQANEARTSSIPSCTLKWQLIGGVGKLLTREGWWEIISTNELFCKLLHFGFSFSVYLLTWTTLGINSPRVC